MMPSTLPRDALEDTECWGVGGRGSESGQCSGGECTSTPPSPVGMKTYPESPPEPGSRGGRGVSNTSSAPAVISYGLSYLLMITCVGQ